MNSMRSQPTQTLLEHDFPAVAASDVLKTSRGVCETAGTPFSSRRPLSNNPEVRIRLYTLSFVALTLQDTERAESLFDHEQSILIPKDPNYFVSLVQLLRKYPDDLIHRTKVEIELCTFLAYHILHEPTIPTYEKGCESDESEDEYQQRVERGISSVRAWDWGSIEKDYSSMLEGMLQDAQTMASI